MYGLQTKQRVQKAYIPILTVRPRLIYSFIDTQILCSYSVVF
jgi:hypothetical protein